MSVLEQFGISSEDLPDIHGDYPKPVTGRIAHIDADFIAYQLAAVTRDELDGITRMRTFEDRCKGAASAIDHIRRLAGAEFSVAHITPPGSDKGGRYGQAVQKEYQANRHGKEAPELLDPMREWLGTVYGARVHLDQEADDGIAQGYYTAENRDDIITCSRDKDLRMVPGLHLDYDTGEIIHSGDDFGFLIEYQKPCIIGGKPSSKTDVKGYGWKWFFYQLLAGDKADNIQGCPKALGRFTYPVMPTKEYTDLLHRLETEKDPKKLRNAEQGIAGLHKRTGSIGMVTAFRIIDPATTVKEAWETVRACWTALEEVGYTYHHWQDNRRVTATQALLGDMRLLWMRRSKNPDDVLDWLKDQLA